MTAVLHEIVAGSANPSLQVQLFDEEGPFNIAAGTVELHYGLNRNHATKTAVDGTVLQASQGTVEFEFTASTFDEAGDWTAQVHVTKGGTLSIFPSAGYFVIRVADEFGEA